ncbi:MAG: hypothetical protein RLP44_28290 [Aggregatilineales bacterium]
MTNDQTWYSRGKADADKGIPSDERVSSIIIAVFSLLMVVFFVNHQTQSTGFFTAEFGTLEQFLFYGYWVVWMTTASLEGIFGLRLLSRLFDVFGGIIFLLISTVVLLIIFPFDFQYLADILPESLRFLLEWISNDIARVVMALGVVGLLFATVYSPIAYKFVGLKPFEHSESSG